MRIVTFNVNSLQRLLGHPLPHIFKSAAAAAVQQQQPQCRQLVKRSKGAATAAAASPTTLAIDERKELEEADDDTAEDFDAAFMIGEEREDDEDEGDDGGDEALAGDSQMDASASRAATAAMTAAAATSVSAEAGVAATPISLRTQAQIDAHESSIAQAARERAALLATLPAGSPSAVDSGARLKGFLDGLQAELICLQEVKMTRARLPAGWALVEGYDAFWSFSRRKQGYSGVATFCKKAPINPLTNTPSRLGACVPLKAEEGLTGSLLSPEARENASAASAVRASAGTAATPASSSSSSSSSVNSNSGSIGEYSTLWSEFDAATLKDLDSEGRCIVTDHGLFVLFNVYMPNAPMHAAENGDTNAAARMEFKLKFQRALQLRTEALVRAGRHVIIVGDVNACHQRIDHADFSSHAKKYKNVSSQQQPMQQQQLQLQRRQPSPTTNKEEEVPFEQHRARAWLHTFLVDGGGVFVDVFRRFYPDRLEAYTCWNTKTAARHSNYGTRIDYVLADQALVEKGFFTACDIRPDIHCSDHCPVQADLRIDSLCDDPARPPPPLCSRFMPEFAGNQQTLQSFFSKATAASTTAAAAAAAPPRSASAAASSSPSASAAGSRSGTASLKRPLSVGAGGSASASASVLSSGAPAKKAKTTIASLNKAGKNSAAAGTPSLRSFFGGAPKPATAAASSPFRTGSVAAAATTPQSSFDAAPAGSGTEDVPTFASSIYGNSAPSSRAGSPVPTSTPFESSGAVLAAAGGGGASAPSSSSNSSSSSAPSAWAALLNQKSVAVTCRCGLQAKLLSVNKAGANQGRKFYICPLPDGPQRCDFFLWAAQRQSKGGGGNGNGAGTR